MEKDDFRNANMNKRCDAPAPARSLAIVERARVKTSVKSRPPRGFTLLEVVVAMAIVGVGVVTVLQIFSSGLRLVGRTSIVSEATGLAREIMDETLSQHSSPAGEQTKAGRDGQRWMVEIRQASIEKEFGLSQAWGLEETAVQVRYRAGFSERNLTIRTLRLVRQRP